MFYLASGYEERVEEVFDHRETRLNAWKGARVQRMHVRARMGARGPQEQAGRASARRRARQARECAGVRGDGGHARGRARGFRTCMLEARLCSGTVHPRARSSPKLKKST
ncbi:hypothetical protein CRG98_037608 [Punica granatum]|uniref:Uncharacterized protein n=1 Tax=Punica granatum TaxID=22663 RepID=A0A2I0IE98_PUNGR|nr:hypothetical protein CRG98_037608 [Punica granatum]